MKPGVAIIGIGCRFPGASSPRAFWSNLLEGRDSVGEVPQSRAALRERYRADPKDGPYHYVRRGGFLRDEELQHFDAAFFGLSDREAGRSEPMHRLALEVAVEALQDAGLPLRSVAGTPLGVFVGASGSGEYSVAQLLDLEQIELHTVAGTVPSFTANRLSYFLDATGPSVVCDTACSSSLVAILLAARSLERGESCLALAGGVNLILSAGPTIALSRARALSPDGQCRAFDAGANGYVRSEGAGFVLLKPLEAALRDGDRIYATLVGGAINQDGKSNGITAPNRLAQEALLAQASRDAWVDPATVSFVECHGTGTHLGDPIEAEALGNVLGKAPGRRAPLWIGSVKSNIGHLEAGAGVAGVIKAALSLRERRLPASLHFSRPNPLIAFDELRLRVAAAAQELPAHGPLHAGVSSFGIGGTNAHLVLAAPEPRRPRAVVPAARPALLLCSARSEAALSAWTPELAAQLERSPERLGELAATVALRRDAFEERCAVVAGSAEAAAAALRGQPVAPGTALIHRARAGKRHRVVWVFSGQGGYRAGLGRALLEQVPPYRQAFEEAARAIEARVGWSPLAEVRAPRHGDAPPASTSVPILFCFQLGLARAFRDAGLVPWGVLGHSAGELAAAVVAGALSLDDAAHVVVERCRALDASGEGAVLAVGASAAVIRRLLPDLGPELDLATVNGPRSVTLSGTTGAVDAAAAALQARKIWCRKVAVVRAMHSRRLDPQLPAFEAAIRGITARPPTLELFSGTAGGKLSGACTDPGHWVRNLRQTVEFESAARGALEARATAFVELAPRELLAGPLRECVSDSGRAAVVFGLEEHDDPFVSWLGAAAAAWANGLPIEAGRFFEGLEGREELPAYRWARKRCWEVDAAGKALDLTAGRRARRVEGSDAGLSRAGTLLPVYGAELAAPATERNAALLQAAVAVLRAEHADRPWALRRLSLAPGSEGAAQGGPLAVELALLPAGDAAAQRLVVAKGVGPPLLSAEVSCGAPPELLPVPPSPPPDLETGARLHARLSGSGGSLLHAARSAAALRVRVRLDQTTPPLRFGLATLAPALLSLFEQPEHALEEVPSNGAWDVVLSEVLRSADRGTPSLAGVESICFEPGEDGGPPAVEVLLERAEPGPRATVTVEAAGRLTLRGCVFELTPAAGEAAAAELPSGASIRDRVLAIFRAVLRTDLATVDLDTNLWNLGMDSLLAQAIVAGLHRELGVQLPFSALLEGPTLRELIARCEGGGPADGAAALDGLRQLGGDELRGLLRRLPSITDEELEQLLSQGTRSGGANR